MTIKRIPETNVGIQEGASVEIFDRFARGMRDKGLLIGLVNSYIRSGIQKGNVLEIGPGPGYVGLEWMKATSATQLTCLEISPEMIKVAHKNSKDYGFNDRVDYVTGNGLEMPFPDNHFDGVLSNGSLHEWEDPDKVFNEIYRILKPGGKFCVTDLRRDISFPIKFLTLRMTKPKEIRPGFISSLNASYTANEIRGILEKTNIEEFTITKNSFGLTISGEKI